MQFNERNVLAHAGTISHELALEHAEGQFERFDAERRRLAASQSSSDFDRMVETTKRLGKGDT